LPFSTGSTFDSCYGFQAHEMEYYIGFDVYVVVKERTVK
jgi:hypothetical protein